MDIRQGGEAKGIVISSIASALAGTGIAVYDLGLEGGRTGAMLPIIASGIGVAPTSLIGLVLGTALAKDHSAIRNSFKVGVGLAVSPIHLRTAPDESVVAHFSPGLHFRVGSPDIHRWRYTASFSRFSGKEFNFENQSSFKGFRDLSRWEFDLNLQYIFPVKEHVEIYPLVGTQYYIIHSAGNSEPRRKLQSEVLTNYGAGLNIILSKNLMLFSEFKSTLDPDPNPTKWSFTGGVYFQFDH